MINRTIVINPIEPAPFSLRAPLGIALDLGILFQAQNGTPVDPDTLKPQLALLPRSAFGVLPYDIATASGENGLGNVSVPGNALIDTAGYNIEIYSRRTADNPVDPPVPNGLLAKGVLRLEGSTYQSYGPLSMINLPTIIGPQGPQGVQGEVGPQGQRGSRWTTGAGDPVQIGDEINGDMYLNETNGDVWRWNGTMWMLGSFA